MSLETEIKLAAKQLERLLNMMPNQMDASIRKTRAHPDAIGSMGAHGLVSEYQFEIVITSTHPVQIYP